MENALVYLDATIIVSAAVSSAKEGEAARNLLFKHPALATSALSFAEALTTIARTLGKEQAVWTCKRFAELHNISTIQGNVTAQLIENFTKTSLNSRQAMHLAYMRVNGITQIASLDPEFDKIQGIKRVKL